MPRNPIHRFWRSPVLPFVESRMARDSSACYAPHSHTSLSIGAVDGGRSVFQHGNKTQSLSRGDVVLIPAGDVHACNAQDDGQWSYQMLYLDPHWVRAVVGEMDSFDAQVLQHLPRHTAPQHLHTRLTELNHCLFGDAPVQDKEAALLLFVGDLFGSVQARRSHAQPDATRLRGVQAMIQARCTETLTLDEMAAQACMSRYHFVRSFKRSVGLTPHAWQLDQRIQRARHLLKQGMGLAEAALHLGFADQSHFQRAFKQRVAATPGDYLRNILQD
ncbi:AraC family transcriptional regulator [Rhodoferax sp.]|uniref:AraC family transcriptional regulator n=1 Tax=Rhodoferax sp. TaxID=50421 RepID=UPI00284EA01D|nr:AraC family transcriptional regulator [Rhodoferax sp.]MDR3371078.1 AraC family transcriptional regulator [Rhodoferax sp.]